jgi:S-DNA-T family DNA segregation ATPase FtsK/SpoIIIE
MEEVQRFNEIIKSFNIKADCIGFNKIRNINMYDIFLTPGERIKTLHKYSEELSLALKSKNKPIIKVVSEQGIVRLEFIDNDSCFVSYLDKIKDMGIDSSNKFPMYLGESVDGKGIFMDTSKNPHLLVGGSTGSGKSVLLHTIIANALIINKDVDLFLVDTKSTEFPIYGGLKNVSVSTSYRDTLETLKFLNEEMDIRYRYMMNNYTSHLNGEFKKILVVIDEYADLIMQDDSKEMYNNIIRLAQKSRASDIYLVIGTQRPSVRVINGEIKANFSARISCLVSSNVDSRIILDEGGAENLGGAGDSIISNYNNKFERFQVAYSDPMEIIEYIKKESK